MRNGKKPEISNQDDHRGNYEVSDHRIDHDSETEQDNSTGGREGSGYEIKRNREKGVKNENEISKESISNGIDSLAFNMDYYANLEYGPYPDPFEYIEDLENRIESAFKQEGVISEKEKQELTVELEEQKKKLIGYMLGFVENELLSKFSTEKGRFSPDLARRDCEEYLGKVKEIISQYEKSLNSIKKREYSKKISSLEEKIEKYYNEPSAYDIEKKCSQIEAELMKIKKEQFSDKLLKINKKSWSDLEHKFISVEPIRSRLNDIEADIIELSDSEKMQDIEDSVVKKDVELEINNLEDFVNQLKDSITFLEKYYKLNTLADKYKRGDVEESDVLEAYQEMEDIYHNYYKEPWTEKDISYGKRDGEGMDGVRTVARKKITDLGIKNFGYSEGESQKTSNSEAQKNETKADFLNTLNLSQSELSDLSQGEAWERIKEQRDKLALKYHPDMGEVADEKRMKEINTAYDELKEFFNQ
ncbi:MAG: J domain-containing protein [Candidatus Magasanikbacteria bacterium]